MLQKQLPKKLIYIIKINFLIKSRSNFKITIGNINNWKFIFIYNFLLSINAKFCFAASRNILQNQHIFSKPQYYFYNFQLYNFKFFYKFVNFKLMNLAPASIYKPFWIYKNNFFKRDVLQKKILLLNLKKNYNIYNINIYDYLYKIILNFFEIFFKKNFYFFCKKTNFLLSRFKKNHFIILLQRKLSKSLKFFQSKFFFKELVEVLWLTFLLKDSSLFTNWFVAIFQNISLRNHKNFLRILNLLLKRYYNFFFKNTNILGFFFDIRGKLGVSGSAKKRHLSISSGLYSSSNKSLKISLTQSGVKTSTGLLGVTFCLFF